MGNCNETRTHTNTETHIESYVKIPKHKISEIKQQQKKAH